MPNDTTNSTDASLSECGHDRFERNHYFHGKLMTARDMAAEQAYHVGQRRAHARSVAGSGVAWGLEPSIRDDDDAVIVTVEAGYGIDDCGRPVVVPQRREKTITDSTKVGATALSVYLRYEACLKESVPIDGAETACEDECAYNRVLEVYDIEVEAADPGGAAAKPVEPVEFPDWDDLESVSEVGREQPSPLDHGLATIAESYRAAAPDETGVADDLRLYLGTFTPGPKDPWVRDETQPMAYVYSNDMLYAATAQHTADFGNPHEVSLTSVDRAADNAAAIHIRDDESTQPEVTLSSTDRSVDVSHSAGNQQIDLSVEAHVERALEERVAPLERYAVEQSLKYKALVFRQAGERFDDPAGATAADIADKARRAADGRLDAESDAAAAETLELADGEGGQRTIDEDVYETLLTEFLGMEQTFRGQVADQVTDASYQRLSAALGRLKSALKPAEPGWLDLGSAQDDVVDAVEWLEPVDEEEPAEPGTATFTDGGVIQEEGGDIATIGIELENTRKATLTVGSSAAGYESTVTVQSGGDDQVSVLMNTYLAGRSAGAESQAFGTAQPADSATATLNTAELSGVLDTGTYDLALSVDGEETDVASLSLNERSTDSLDVYRAPASVFDTLTDGQAVLDAIDDGTLSDGAVDPGETVVGEVAVSGVFGAIASTLGDPTDVDPRGIAPLQNDEIVELAVGQTDADDAAPKRLDLWQSVKQDSANLFAHPGENRLLLVVDTGEAVFHRGADPTAVQPAVNESYEAAFAVLANGALADATERVTGAFEMAELIVRVPPVTDMSYTQASMRLENAQLSANPTYVEIDSPTHLSRGVVYDQVTHQNPDDGRSVEAGSEVDLRVLTSRDIQGTVSGIGSQYAGILQNQGYEYIHQLEDAKAAELQAHFPPNVTEAQIQNWIDQAKQERVAVELSLREGTGIQESREVATAFVESGRTNVAAMTDQQVQRIITQGVQNQVIDAQMSDTFLANSTNLTSITGGGTTDFTDFTNF